jgi:hypothetical protein
VENKISAFLNKLLPVKFDISAQFILKNCFPLEYKISAQNPIFQITTNKKNGDCIYQSQPCLMEFRQNLSLLIEDMPHIFRSRFFPPSRSLSPFLLIILL